MPEQGNPFAPGGGGGVFQVQPTDLMALLQTAFPTAPPPTKMALPNVTPQETQMIDLGAGGQRPGTRQSGIANMLGSAVSAAGQLYGASKAASNANAGGAWNNSALGNTPNITAPQLGAAPAFSTAGLNASLSAPTPQFSLTRNLTPQPFKLGG